MINSELVHNAGPPCHHVHITTAFQKDGDDAYLKIWRSSHTAKLIRLTAADQLPHIHLQALICFTARTYLNVRRALPYMMSRELD